MISRRAWVGCVLSLIVLSEAVHSNVSNSAPAPDVVQKLIGSIGDVTIEMPIGVESASTISRTRPQPFPVRPWENPESATAPLVCDPNRYPDIEAHWIGAMPWLMGNPIAGGLTLNGGIGREMLGSVESNLLPGQHVPVEIHFDPAETTLCQVYRIETNFGPVGVGVFPGSAWDMSDPDNPRRLNLCFTEYNDGAGPIVPPNLFWDPDTTRNSPYLGKFEFLFIMLSDYDGTGLTYAGLNPNFTDLDMLYFWYPRLVPGHTWFETLPAALEIRVFYDYVTDQSTVPGDAELTLNWTYCGDGQHTGFRLLRSPYGTEPHDSLATVPAGTTSFLDTGLVNDSSYSYRVLILGPADSVMGWGNVVHGTPQKLFENMTLLGQWDTMTAQWGGIWVWIDPDNGKEYALMCARDGARVAMMDIDQNPPKIVAELPGGFDDTKEVKVYGNYVYVLSEFGPITIYDVSNVPAVYNPPLAGTVNPDGGGSHNLLIDGDYLYVVGNHGIGGLEIFSLANPTAPTKVGEFQPFYYHDVTIRRDTLYAYGIYGDGIDIIDVSNKTSPQLISRFNYPGSGAHNGELSYDGKYLFIGDEIGGGPWTRVFDVSDPLNVSFVDDIIVDQLSIAHNCYRRNNILYIAHYDRGVRAYDVSDPTSPVEVGFYDTQPALGGGFSGAWTALPLPSGRIIASDMDNGLFVLQFDGNETPYCACQCLGDPSCNGVRDVVDVVQTINTAFRGAPANSDPGENCSAETTDLNCDDATSIVDVVRMVNVVFRGADPLAEICDPCAP